jgi:hypothetical protein
MNTSRDIEKLFDHFGGNAGDYQEIGRENEAKSARTRWPLLATLDLAQPAIPEIVPRREAQSIARPAAQPEPVQPAATEPASAPALTPINRPVKAPLFARAHRRSIPPVNANPSIDAHRATRFSALADTTPDASAVPNEKPATDAPAPQTRQPLEAESRSALASAAAAIARANSSAFSQVDGHRTAQTTQATQSAHSAQPALSSLRKELAPSILGKLFDQPKPAPQSNSLNSLFDRLRSAGDDPSGGDTARRPARAWGSR